MSWRMQNSISPAKPGARSCAADRSSGRLRARGSPARRGNIATAARIHPTPGRRCNQFVLTPSIAVWVGLRRHVAGNQSPRTIVESTRPDALMLDFSVRMINQLQFSSCEAPWLPITEPRQETLAVDLRDDLLTLTEVRVTGGHGSRIYAQRTVSLLGAMAFVILPQLPSRIRDGAFFPALGTVVLFETADGGKRRLRAIGTDTNSRRCRGWIFDALEA